MTVALVHDYLTQRGGAERVVLSLGRAFPDAPVHTSLYEPAATFPGFRDKVVVATALDAIGPLRRHHRWGLPLYAVAFSRMVVDADVTICSSSGWAHGARTTGRKIVYCHAPARWLYQTPAYLGSAKWARAGDPLRALLAPWDRRAAATADRYLTNSRAVQARIRQLYGIEAEVVPPPHTLGTGAPRQAVPGLDAGFFLCVSRLLPYKNVAAVVAAFSARPDRQLVVVGAGPDERSLRSAAAANVRFLGSVDDAQLRWLYAGATAVVAASYEDYGLTPVEAGAFGTPSVVLRWGGFLDTVVDGETGVFFDEPEPGLIGDAVRRLEAAPPKPEVVRTHAERFSEYAFIARMQDVATAVGAGS